MTPSCPTSRLVAALAFTAALTGASLAAGVAVVVVAVKRRSTGVTDPFINQEESP